MRVLAREWPSGSAEAEALARPKESISAVRVRELDRLAEETWKEVLHPRWRFPVAYARLIHAVQREGARLVLSSLGRVFLRLPGWDAVRWLLHVEAAQSTGMHDKRLSREAAERLILAVNEGESVDEFHPRWHENQEIAAIIERLAGLGVLVLFGTEHQYVYSWAARPKRWSLTRPGEALLRFLSSNRLTRQSPQGIWACTRPSVRQNRA